MPEQVQASVSEPTPIPPRPTMYGIIQAVPIPSVLHLYTNVVEASYQAAKWPGSVIVTIPASPTPSARPEQPKAETDAELLARIFGDAKFTFLGSKQMTPEVESKLRHVADMGHEGLRIALAHIYWMREQQRPHDPPKACGEIGDDFLPPGMLTLDAEYRRGCIREPEARFFVHRDARWRAYLRSRPHEGCFCPHCNPDPSLTKPKPQETKLAALVYRAEMAVERLGFTDGIGTPSAGIDLVCTLRELRDLLPEPPPQSPCAHMRVPSNCAICSPPKPQETQARDWQEPMEKLISAASAVAGRLDSEDECNCGMCEAIAGADLVLDLDAISSGVPRRADFARAPMPPDIQPKPPAAPGDKELDALMKRMQDAYHGAKGAGFAKINKIDALNLINSLNDLRQERDEAVRMQADLRIKLSVCEGERHEERSRHALALLAARTEHVLKCPICTGDSVRLKEENAALSAKLSALEGIRAGGPTIAPSLAQDCKLLQRYAVASGSHHDDGCPGDDTCNCSWKPVSEAVERLCKLGNSPPAPQEPKPKQCPRCGEEHDPDDYKACRLWGRCATCGHDASDHVDPTDEADGSDTHCHHGAWEERCDCEEFVPQTGTGTFHCPICGKDTPHQHSGAEMQEYQPRPKSTASPHQEPKPCVTCGHFRRCHHHADHHVELGCNVKARCCMEYIPPPASSPSPEPAKRTPVSMAELQAMDIQFGEPGEDAADFVQRIRRGDPPPPTGEEKRVRTFRHQDGDCTIEWRDGIATYKFASGSDDQKIGCTPERMQDHIDRKTWIEVPDAPQTSPEQRTKEQVKP